MGCDIHIWVEVRASEDAPWEFVRRLPAWPCPSCGGGRAPGCRECAGSGVSHGTWHERYYRLFSALAGVRRGPGDPEPVSAPRGFPVDMSDGLRAFMRDDEPNIDDLEAANVPPADWPRHPGDHSASWLSLREVTAALETHDVLRAKTTGFHDFVRACTALVVPASGLPNAWEHARARDRVRLVFNFDS